MNMLRRSCFSLVCLLAFLISVDLAWHSYVGFVRDDAYITYRYAENVTDGRGLVYNAGERVQGISSPGLAVLLAASLEVFRNVFSAALGLDILASMVSLFLLWKLFEHFSIPNGQRILSLFILIWSDKLLLHFLEGMETPLVVGCMLASLYFLVKQKPIFAGLAAGVMLWLRLDSGLWIAAIAGVGWFYWRRNTTLFLLIAALTYLPWVLFAWSYFGSVIPLSVIAKQVAYGLHEAPLRSRMAAYFGWMAPFSLGVDPAGDSLAAIVTLGVAAFGAWSYRRIVFVRVLGLFFIIQSAAIIALNMTVEERYFVTSLYVLLILLGLGFNAILVRYTSRAPWRLTVLIALYAIIAFSFALPRMRHLRDHQHYVNDSSLTQVGIWFRENTPASSVVELEPLGYVGYYAGRRMLDDVGLATPAVVALKKAGLDSFQVVMELEPDYAVLHCDDAKRAPTGFDYPMVVRFDPLGFESDAEWWDKAVQRNACYEIHVRSPHN
jgi:hypothetical protein